MTAAHDFIISPPAIPGVPVVGHDTLFPVRRIYCVGRNYAAHTVEMGGDPDREDPFFFQKNPDSVLTGGAAMPYPPLTSDLHHEIEMAVALASGGRNIPVDQAQNHIFGYGAAIDMTRRDLQGNMKAARRPWEIGKSFEHSCPIGALSPIASTGASTGALIDGRISLTVNGAVRQEGDLNQMIWKVPEIIAYLSTYFELAAGDLILTGTPSGVAACGVGDTLIGEVAGLEPVHVTIQEGPTP